MYIATWCSNTNSSNSLISSIPQHATRLLISISIFSCSVLVWKPSLLTSSFCNWKYFGDWKLEAKLQQSKPQPCINNTHMLNNNFLLWISHEPELLWNTAVTAPYWRIGLLCWACWAFSVTFAEVIRGKLQIQIAAKKGIWEKCCVYGKRILGIHGAIFLI